MDVGIIQSVLLTGIGVVNFLRILIAADNHRNRPVLVLPSRRSAKDASGASGYDHGVHGSKMLFWGSIPLAAVPGELVSGIESDSCM